MQAHRLLPPRGQQTPGGAHGAAACLLAPRSPLNALKEYMRSYTFRLKRGAWSGIEHQDFSQGWDCVEPNTRQRSFFPKVQTKAAFERILYPAVHFTRKGVTALWDFRLSLIHVYCTLGHDEKLDRNCWSQEEMLGKHRLHDASWGPCKALSRLSFYISGRWRLRNSTEKKQPLLPTQVKFSQQFNKFKFKVDFVWCRICFWWMTREKTWNTYLAKLKMCPLQKFTRQESCFSDRSPRRTEMGNSLDDPHVRIATVWHGGAAVQRLSPFKPLLKIHLHKVFF